MSRYPPSLPAPGSHPRYLATRYVGAWSREFAALGRQLLAAPSTDEAIRRHRESILAAGIHRLAEVPWRRDPMRLHFASAPRRRRIDGIPLACLLSTADGIITAANRRARERLAFEHPVGVPWLVFIHAEARAAFLEGWAAFLARGELFRDAWAIRLQPVAAPAREVLLAARRLQAGDADGQLMWVFD